MDTLNKYRKESEGYVPNYLHSHKNYKYNPSHTKFVVPWQMEDVKPVKEKETS